MEKFVKPLKMLTAVAVLSTMINTMASASSENNHWRAGLDYGYTTHRANQFTVPKIKFVFSADAICQALEPQNTSHGCFQYVTSFLKNVTESKENWFFKQVARKTLDLFPGKSVDEKRSAFTYALQNTALLNSEVRSCDFSSKKANQIAEALFDALKPATARFLAIEEAKKAGITSGSAALLKTAKVAEGLFEGIIDLYKHGTITDSAVDVEAWEENRVESYPQVIESLKRLGAQHSFLTAQLSSSSGRKKIN
jgi:hypothetical protein